MILATMNPLDRGVDEVDAALERRFAKIAMDPDEEILGQLLTEARMPDALRRRVHEFFGETNRTAASNPHAALGHTYFTGISDVDGLRRLWEHQLRFHFEKAYRLDAEGLERVRGNWDRLLRVGAEGPPDAGNATGPDAVAVPGTTRADDDRLHYRSARPLR